MSTSGGRCGTSDAHHPTLRPWACTTSTLTELSFGLRQQVLLLLIGNTDEDVPFVYAIPEIGVHFDNTAIDFSADNTFIKRKQRSDRLHHAANLF